MRCEARVYKWQNYRCIPKAFRGGTCLYSSWVKTSLCLNLQDLFMCLTPTSLHPQLDNFPYSNKNGPDSQYQ